MKAKLEITEAIWLPAISTVPTHPIMMPVRAKALPSMNIWSDIGAPTRIRERIISHEKFYLRNNLK